MFYGDLGILFKPIRLKKLKSNNFPEKIWTKMKRLGKKRKI